MKGEKDLNGFLTRALPATGAHRITVERQGPSDIPLSSLSACGGEQYAACPHSSGRCRLGVLIFHACARARALCAHTHTHTASALQPCLCAPGCTPSMLCCCLHTPNRDGIIVVATCVFMKLKGSCTCSIHAKVH